jgi:polyisoprenoid-binding protein YceI
LEVEVMATRKRLFVAGISTSLFTLSVAGYAALSSSADSHVTFQASGPAGMTIEGSTTDLKVSEDGGNIVIDVPLANLATGIALRDHHMKEKYLEVPKYPSTTLVIARSALKFPAKDDHAEGDVPGVLKLHGQSHPVTVHYEAKGNGAGFAAQGKFRLNMNDYGISVPSYLGVTVKPDVEVSASFSVTGS